ncbi:hypothetical protein [Oceanicaulis sp.]|uniref:hypothetical protein n=1 Tax=Oceanicaulis sp. TaxID=1924941 RepID=UPI003F6FDC68
MTEAERRAAAEPIQDVLNDLTSIIRRFEQTLTTPGAVREGAEDPALQFVAALKQAQREGLHCVRIVRNGD